jgi:hypothetical protein
MAPAPVPVLAACALAGMRALVPDAARARRVLRLGRGRLGPALAAPPR